MGHVGGAKLFDFIPIGETPGAGFHLTTAINGHDRCAIIGRKIKRAGGVSHMMIDIGYMNILAVDRHNLFYAGNVW